MTAIWVVVAATGLSGGVALAAHAGPCAVDPPPGDVGQLPLVNNTTRDLHFFECDPASCSSGFNLHPLPPPRRRHTSNTNSAQALRSGSPTPPGHWWAA